MNSKPPSCRAAELRQLTAGGGRLAAARASSGDDSDELLLRQPALVETVTNAGSSRLRGEFVTREWEFVTREREFVTRERA